MPSLLSTTQQAEFQRAIADVFWSFARPFSLYVEANTAVISTSLTYSRFGMHDQNEPVGVDNPAVTPQVYTVTGCLLYGENQPWTYISPDGATSAQELKLREADGVIRIKVEATGHALLSQCKLVVVDGLQFQLNSTPRPHGIAGSPDRWTYRAEIIQ